jgi:hypothetical protein
VRLTVPLDLIEQRLAGDVTSGRRDDLREAAKQVTQKTSFEDLAVANDRPVNVVAQEIMTYLAWP